ncbi:hypothetical protein A2U01_0048646, partial [Trifolium medium]|nr:hypothetical protein [Trifolium medium]
ARVCSLCTQRESVETGQNGGAGHDFGSLVAQWIEPGSDLGPVQNTNLTITY